MRVPRRPHFLTPVEVPVDTYRQCIPLPLLGGERCQPQIGPRSVLVPLVASLRSGSRPVGPPRPLLLSAMLCSSSASQSTSLLFCSHENVFCMKGTPIHPHEVRK